MSLIESDLRLSLDDQQETPFPGIARSGWPIGTPVQGAYSSWTPIADLGSDDQTPATVVLGTFGCGKSSVLSAYLAGFYASKPTGPNQRVYWIMFDRCLDLPGWRDRRTPTQSDPTGRTHYLVRLRKFHETSLLRQTDENSGIRAIRQLCAWLQITQADAASVAGLSERTFYHWQANPSVQPRLRSVEQLSKVHAFVEGLVSDFGENWVRDWMRAGDPPRLERLRHPDDFRGVEDDALEVMRRGALQTVVEGRSGWTESLPDASRDAELFAAREVGITEPLPSLIIVSRDREDDRE